MWPARRESSRVGRRDSSSRRASRSLRAKRQGALQHVARRQHAQLVAQLPRTAPAVEHGDDGVQVKPGILLQAAEHARKPRAPAEAADLHHPEVHGGILPRLRVQCGHACLAWTALPARRHLGRPRRQLRAVLRARDDGRALPVRFAGRRAGGAPRFRSPSRPTRSGTATCPTCGPASSTATASTGPTRRTPGTASTRAKSCSTRTPRPSAAPLRWDDALFGYAPGRHGDDLVRDDRDSAAFAPLAAVIDPAFTWGDDRRAADAVAQDGHLRAARQGLHRAPPGGARRRCAAPTSGLASEPAHPAPDRPRRHGRRAAAGPPPRRRPPPGRARPDELLGLQHARRSSPPTSRFAQRDGPHGRRARVQDDGPRAARGRHRGDSRRGLQPHRRGQPPRADALAARHRQRLLLPPRRRTTRATTWTSPAAATR